MLTTKRINLGISILSRILRIFIIIYSASILANCIWWVLSPANANIFIQWADLDVHDKATSYVNNRNPFGVIMTVKPKAERPHIVDQLKLTGVYLNTNKDSFAFLEYHGKPTITRIGDQIADSGAIVKSIGASSIVVTADDQDATIAVSVGTASHAASPLRNLNNSGTMFGSGGENNIRNENPNTIPQPTAPTSEEFNRQRKRMLNEFNAHGSRVQESRSSSDYE